MPRGNEDLKVCRIASLTLVNAMIFQQILAGQDRRIPALSRTLSESDTAEAFSNVWELIVNEIDYVPIFTLASQIIKELAGNPDFAEALRVLAKSALRITARRAALRHDLMGRIYHRLLADAKYFGAFYTTVPASVLLLKLALDPEIQDIDWADMEKIQDLRIADLACGTGTLLKATLQTVVDNHVRARAEYGRFPDLNRVYDPPLIS